MIAAPFPVFSIGGIMIALLNVALGFKKGIEPFHRLWMVAVGMIGLYLTAIGLPAFSMFIGIIAGVFSWCATYLPLHHPDDKKPVKD